MPDLDLVTEGGPVRVSALMHEARPLLMVFGARDRIQVSGWEDRVERIDAHCEDPWDLPAIGVVAAPAAVLVRPDGYVAWVGDGTQEGLADALEKWLGPASS
jgi:3-(3-hydroxy-phenyl)propionate hydroxylase